MATPKRNRLLTSAKHLLQQWLAPYRRRLLLAVGAAALSVPLLLWQMWCLATISGLWLAGHAVDAQWFWQFTFVFCIRHGLLLWRDYQTSRCSMDLRISLRQQLLTRIAWQGPARAHFGSDGTLSTLLTEQVDALDGYIRGYWPQLVLVVWTPLCIAVAVSWHSPLAGGLMLITAPLVPFFMILVGREAASASSAKLKELNHLSGRLWQFLQGLVLLRRFNAIEIATIQLSDAAERFRRSTLAVLRLAFLSTAVLEFFSALAIALVAVYLGFGLVGELPFAKNTTPVSFIPALYILLLAPDFYQPLRQLGNDYHAKAQAEAAVLQLKPLWQLPEPPEEAVVQIAPMRPNLSPNMLELTQIVVGPSARPRLQIDHVAIAVGQRILLSGDSGSGKSTLLQLLAGFATYQGQYCLQQEPVTQANRPKLWQQLSYLGQSAELMAGTIADNLRVVRPETDDEQLQQVLCEVGLWHQLQPQGLNYAIGEMGQGLSGGQQQRLCLARMLLADKPLWLLDEPFAQLDLATAIELAALLGRLSEGRTVILATHQAAQLGHALAFLTEHWQLVQGRLYMDAPSEGRA